MVLRLLLGRVLRVPVCERIIGSGENLLIIHVGTGLGWQPAMFGLIDCWCVLPVVLDPRLAIDWRRMESRYILGDYYGTIANGCRSLGSGQSSVYWFRGGCCAAVAFVSVLSLASAT